jgi:rubrerythrin
VLLLLVKNYEHTKMYPEFAKIAKEEGFEEAAKVFTEIGEVEEQHEKRYLKLKENVDNEKVFKRDEEVLWKCRNCGYVHKGNEAPKTMPCLRSYSKLL